MRKGLIRNTEDRVDNFMDNKNDLDLSMNQSWLISLNDFIKKKKVGGNLLKKNYKKLKMIIKSYHYKLAI